ncbi:MAG: hypothetical protein ACFFE2_09775 [Candidatus Thorarchaeota archaeon]
MSTPLGEMLVLSSDSAFQLKLIPLNPYQFTGAGVELPESCDAVDSIRSSPEFGLRPLSESDLQGMLNSLTGEKGPKLSLDDILKRVPQSIDDISADTPSPILRGPVLMRPNLGSLSPEILKRQISLDRSAEKTFRKRFPERAGMYF